MSPRRVLVTGGSGFIGTNTVEHLLRLGDVVGNLDHAPPRDERQASWWIPGDITDRAHTIRSVEEFAPDAIVHLAARADLGGTTLNDYSANVEGVTNIVAAARAAGTTRRVLFGSSQLVCTPGHIPEDEYDVSPPNAYGESKVLGEQIVRAEAGDDAFTWMLLRPTSIWGPWFGELYSAFFRTVGRGRYLHPRGRHIHKSFGFVGNTTYQLERLLAAPDDAVHRRMVYLADYEPYPIREWAGMIQEALGARPVREVPLPVLRGLALGGDVAKRFGVAHPLISSYRLRNILTDTVFPLEPLRELCGDLPYSLAEGTRLTAEWLRAHPS
jgi:nucleoside-diphosphate-sugar epimerase